MYNPGQTDIFENRQDAGRHLATQLLEYESQGVVVLAIPNGGVPVGLEVATALKADFDVIISLGGGRPGVKEWVLFVGDPTGVPIGGGVAAVVAPQLYPYYPRQLFGLLGGVKGAAEYESELIRVHPRVAEMDTPGLLMMGPQTLAHVVIMAFIVIGNVVFFRGRRREDEK